MLACWKHFRGMNNTAEYECRFECGFDTCKMGHVFCNSAQALIPAKWSFGECTQLKVECSHDKTLAFVTKLRKKCAHALGLFVTQQPDASTRVIDLRPDLFLLSDRLPLETICYDGAYKVRYELGTAICGSYKPSKGIALNVGSSPLKSQPFKSPGSSFLFHCCFASRKWCGCKRCFGSSALFCSFEVNVFCFCFLNK